MKKVSIKIDVQGTFAESEFINLYAGYLVSSLNPNMDNNCKRLYNEIGSQLYEQAKAQGLDIQTIHQDVLDFVNNPIHLEKAMNKFKNDLS